MYTEKQLQEKFDVSVNGLKTRIRHLKLKPTKGDRGVNLYDEEQVGLLTQQHKHLAAGGLLNTFIPAISVEIVPAKSNRTPLRSDSQSRLAVVRHNCELEKFKDTCTDMAYADPFWDYELLQRASDRSMYLPTEKLAVIMSRSPSSFSRKKSFTYQGFVMVRQGDRSGNSYVWSINANQ
jgi:hypothetical protein